jgi:hypothetical protein
VPFPFTHSLPPLGAHETDTLDFKAEVKPKAGQKCADRFELAKDVASFANAFGGTVLVGACGGSVLTAYKAIDTATATWLAREYEEAVRDRCAPPVTIRTESLACDTGVVLGIHVPPFPSPIAVRVHGDAGDGSGDDAWVFFSRLASQNKPFRPEMLPMLTPESRRTAILLQSIPANAVVHAVSRTKNEGGRVDMPNSTLLSVDEMANTVVLRMEKGAERRIPLDCIRTVFRGDSGRWHLEIEHYFQIH